MPHEWIIVLFTSLSFSTVSTSDQMNTPIIKSFDYRHLKQAMEGKHEKPLYIVDVREQEEIDETGMIPGSIHVPLGEVESALSLTAEEFQRKYRSDKPKEDENLVFVCKIGVRSYTACQMALKLGFHNVANYEHGWVDWNDKINQEGIPQ